MLADLYLLDKFTHWSKISKKNKKKQEPITTVYLLWGGLSTMTDRSTEPVVVLLV